MALTYTVYVEADNGGGVLGSDASSTSRTYNAGEMVTVVFVAGDTGNVGTVTISNTNTAQTWTNIGTASAASNCEVTAYRCVMSTTQAMVITAAGDSTNSGNGHLIIIVEVGQHATTPVPAGNVFAGNSATDPSQSITPTSAGSNLWMICADWNQAGAANVNAGANCTEINGQDVSGQYTSILVRPTTQPRPDTSAFTIAESDTGGKIAWLAWEVQADAGGGGGGDWGVYYIRA